MRNSRKYFTFLVISLGFSPVVSAQSIDDELATIRSATAKYKDVNVALADGYIRDPANACVSAGEEGLPPEWGAMGIHYLNMARLGITTGEPRVDGNGLNTDFTKPSVLMYEPQADGSLELLGVENLVFQAAWQAAGNYSPPMLAGAEWDTMADDMSTEGDEAHNFEPHYDRHVWAFRENPAGPVVPFNAAVSCEFHGS